MIKRLWGSAAALLLLWAAPAWAEPSLSAPQTITPGVSCTIYFDLETEQLVDIWLIQGGKKQVAVTQEHESAAGVNTLTWDGRTFMVDAPAGDYEMVLYAQEGQASQAVTVTGEGTPTALQVMPAASPAPVILEQADTGDPAAAPASPETLPAPASYSPYTCAHESCYWTLPMGELDEEAIWNVMMQPMTVVKGSHQRQIIPLRSEPREDAAPTGEVTCLSQGVHVLENLDNGWSLVECYSSSAAKSTVKVWAKLVQGYIKTERLEIKEAAPKYGLLIDKLNQTLYVFEEGKILGELLVSTGLVNKKQPFNETPAGEFMTVSWSGGFWSGNMYCDMGIRINAGILLHEVPCLISNSGVRNYAPFEPKLGQKASHGCIRIQQKENAQGLNMKWLWDHLKDDQPGDYTRTKVLIWDDAGRILPIPAADTPMYYNPSGGKYYHLEQNCSSVKDRWLPLTEISYESLEGEFAQLTPCPYCNPPMKASEIQAQNEANLAKALGSE